VAVWVRWVLLEVGVLAEVVYGHGGEHGDDDVVVGEVGVERASEGEVGGVVGEGAVDGAVGARDVLVGQASEQLLLVAQSLSAAGRATKGIVIVVFNVEGLLESLPLTQGEKIAEVRHANIAVLVRADRLHGVRVVVVELKTSWSVLVHSSCGGTNVLRHVLEEQVKVAQVRALQVIFEAAVVRCKRVVLSTTFRNDDNIEQRAIDKAVETWRWSLVEGRTEEAQSPTDLGVLNARLTGCPQHRLGTSSRILVGCVVLELTWSGVEQGPTVAVPEGDTSCELGRSSEASQL